MIFFIFNDIRYLPYSASTGTSRYAEIAAQAAEAEHRSSVAGSRSITPEEVSCLSMVDRYSILHRVRNTLPALSVRPTLNLFHNQSMSCCRCLSL